MPYLVLERLLLIIDFDTDTEGLISKESFLLNFRNKLFVKESQQRNIIKLVFDIYDFDNDGIINRSDLITIFSVVFSYNFYYDYNNNSKKMYDGLSSK